MTGDGADLVTALRAALPTDGAVSTAGTANWIVSGTIPSAVVFPETPAEAANVLSLSSTEGWQVVLAGQGTWLDSVMAPPAGRPTIVVSTQRMDRIVEYEPADLTMTVEAGATLQTLRAATAPEGQWLPLDPRPDDDGSIGATLATASAGPLASLVGAPRDLTLGLRLVTGDGRLLSVGGKVMKNVAGFDLVRLSVGSSGTLGMITEATLRLYPRPEVDAVFKIHDDPTALAEVARSAASGPFDLAGLELYEPGLDDSGRATLVLRLIGSAEEVAAIEDHVVTTTGRARWERVPKEAVEKTLGMLRSWHRGASVVLRLSMLPSRLDEGRVSIDHFRSACKASFAEVRISAVTDVIGGRTTVGLHSLEPSGSTPLADAIGALRDTVEATDGTVRVLSGGTSPPDSQRVPSPTLSIVDGITSAFDPAGILPGRSRRR